MANAPRVFVSYSHDSEDHVGLVLALADALHANGIEVILDQYVFPGPEEGWPRWMDSNIERAKFVLLVCTETYRRRVMGQEEPGKGLGVRWEGSLIYNRIYHDKPGGSRFIPILLPGSELAHLPNPVQGHTRYRIATFDLNDPGFEGLLRHLTGQAPTPPPPLGTTPALPPKPRRVSSPDPRSSPEPAPDRKSKPAPETDSDRRPKRAEAAGIFLTRIIHPPIHEGRSTRSEVFLSTKGDRTYIVDSVEIRHIKGMFLSMASGAVVPDATYRFTYTEGSAQVHALNPALRLSPHDPREVWFTLGIALGGRLSSVGGSLIVHLHYHLDDGSMGKLLLAPPSPEGVYLADLIGQNIMVGEVWTYPASLFGQNIEVDQRQIITPTGAQLGQEQQRFPKITYLPLNIYILKFDCIKTQLPEKLPTIINWEERVPLNEQIVEKKKVEKVYQDLWTENQDLVLDLCAGLPDLRAERAILALSEPGALALAARKANDERTFHLEIPVPLRQLKALAIRHLLQPSDTLARFILKHRGELSNTIRHPDGNEIHESGLVEVGSSALLARPCGEWVGALLALTREDHNALPVLCMRRDLLDASQRKAIRDYCWETFDQWRVPPSEAVYYLIWEGEPVTKVEERLLKIPTENAGIWPLVTRLLGLPRKGWVAKSREKLCEQVIGLQLLSDALGVGLQFEEVVTLPRSKGGETAKTQLQTFDITQNEPNFRSPDFESTVGEIKPAEGRKRLGEYIEAKGLWDRLRQVCLIDLHASLLAIELLSESPNSNTQSFLESLAKSPIKAERAYRVLSYRRLRQH